MSPERWSQAKVLFDEARRRPPASRGAFLDDACGGDAELRGEVERLLSTEAEADAFFDTFGLVGLGGAPGGDGAPAPLRPRSVGPWKVVGVLGHGGMGQVFEARRADGLFEQRAALKVVRPGGAADLVARFRAERRVLATLEHPGIARLIDGGVTDDGRPYFAMEYVEGEPLLAFADAERLGIEDRLRLFRDVCDTVAYAHRRLVVHRDLKPSNILVTAEGTDRTPAPKLLDFGIAKLLDEADAEGLTATGTPLMTPEYASPEQATGEAITTATDVYALGVLLFELLTGHRPYAFPERSPQAVTRVICEAEPALPSAVVERPAELKSRGGETMTVPPAELARRRRVTPERLRRRLAGDLDTICLKALRKEPDRRYASADALADDIRRHLDGLPVRARRDTVGYRMRKFVRRHRVGVAASTLVVLSLAVALSLALWHAQLARNDAARAHEVATFMTELLQEFNPNRSRGGVVTAEAVLDQAVVRVEEALGSNPAVQAHLFDQLGMIYQSYGHFDDAGSLLQRALALRRALHGTHHATIAESLHNLAWYWHVRGDYDRAEALYDEARAVHRRLGTEGGLDNAANLEGLALLARIRSDTARAERMLREVLAIRRAALPAGHPTIGASLTALAYLLTQREAYGEADALYREALAIQRRAFGVHVQTAQVLHDYGALLTATGAYDRAEAHFREALSIRRSLLGASHPYLALSLHHIGWLYHLQGRYADAEPLYAEALAIQEAHFGTEHLAVANSRLVLGEARFHLGEVEAGLGLQRQAVALYERLLRPGHPSAAAAKLRFGRSLTVAGRYDEAEQHLQRSLAAFEAEGGPEHPRTREAAAALAALHVARADA